MIYYFSATGNSQHVATRIAEALGTQAHIELFPGMNHGQLLIDYPEEIAQSITQITAWHGICSHSRG